MLELIATNHAGEPVGTDTITVVNESGESAAAAGDLVVSEIMYHPGDGGVEFIELLNTGEALLDLTGVRFSQGVAFTFANGTKLAASGRLILTEDATRFAAIYGDEIGVAGVFGDGTRLSNSGETLTLLDESGNIIESFVYNDRGDWPATADGEGKSLVRTETGNDPNLAQSWQASRVDGGMPGRDDGSVSLNPFRIKTIDRTPSQGIRLVVSSQPGERYTIQFSQPL